MKFKLRLVITKSTSNLWNFRVKLLKRRGHTYGQKIVCKQNYIFGAALALMAIYPAKESHLEYARISKTIIHQHSAAEVFVIEISISPKNSKCFLNIHSAAVNALSDRYCAIFALDFRFRFSASM